MTTETKFTVGDYKTREERAAKVFIVNDDGTLIGARKLGDGSWTSEMWFSDGRARVFGPNPHDLMPPLREWWVVRTDYDGNHVFTYSRAAEDFNREQHDEKAEIIHVREVRDDQA